MECDKNRCYTMHDLILERDSLRARLATAWKELREIREAISANDEESTVDEVRRVMAQLAEAERELEDARKCPNEEWECQKEIKALMRERDQARAECQRLEAECGAMRTAMEGYHDWVGAHITSMECRSDGNCGHCLLAQYEDDARKVLDSDAGRKVQERVEALERVAEAAKAFQEYVPEKEKFDSSLNKQRSFDEYTALSNNLRKALAALEGKDE